MNRGCLVITTTALLTTHAFAGPASAPIIGGTTTQVGQFPSVVALEVGGGLCTGTLLTPEWILTAAHCVSTQVAGGTQASITSGLRIHFSTVNVFNNAGRVVRASESIPNPAFNINAVGSGDIGLIRIATPVTDLPIVPINLDAARAPVGIQVTMVGYGITMGGGSGSGVQRTVEQTSVNCTAGAGSNATLLCYAQTNGRGKCQGDSGGPSFSMIGNQLTQVGISSFGDQTCSNFGADTRTDAERAFLLQHVPELQCQTDGVCAEACGQDGLPVDADCPVCATDSDCDDGEACFEGTCVPEPFSPGGLGTECTNSDECAIGECATGPGGESRCTELCTLGAADACPAAFECIGATGDNGACWPAEDGGCCDASGRGAPTALAMTALLGVLLFRRRRARA